MRNKSHQQSLVVESLVESRRENPGFQAPSGIFKVRAVGRFDGQLGLDAAHHTHPQQQSKSSGEQRC